MCVSEGEGGVRTQIYAVREHIERVFRSQRRERERGCASL